MEPSFRSVRGMSDIVGDEMRRFERVLRAARRVADLYAFEPISTPIVEYEEVFCRAMGETSDAVSKEIYRLVDKGGDALALRPEFTAGVARAYVTGAMQHAKPLKFFSFGPIFRYERPQKGRRRQFHQVNFEFFGAASSFADVECISAAAHLLRELEPSGVTTLEINSLGDAESRTAYRAALVEYLAPYESDLSDDSKRRLAHNPLRILDSKDARDKDICAGAPSLANALNAASRAFFDEVLQGLEEANVSYVRNPNLVRGLDYYCHTAFEFTNDALGAQNTVLAGGRYDGLIAQMGGDHTPAVGFAAGVERLCELIALPEKKDASVFCVSVGDDARAYVAAFVRALRENGVAANWFPEGNVRKQFKVADKKNARIVCAAGENEVAQGLITLKNMETGEQETLSRESAVARLAKRDASL
ncbi:MAG: histidine--tRNA ligase [Rickettsiales bacterium]